MKIEEIDENSSNSGRRDEDDGGNGGSSSKTDKRFAAMIGVSKAVQAFNKFKKKDKPTASSNQSAKKDAFLIDAASRGDLNLVTKFITESGCSPDLKDPEGKCIVQLALEGGHDSVVMYLLMEHGARVAPAKGLRYDGVMMNGFEISPAQALTTFLFFSLIISDILSVRALSLQF